MATSNNIIRRLTESIHDEPNRMLVPISGYEKETVTSLDEACESIKDLLDENLKQYMTITKMNSMKPKDKLTQDESASIHLYTMEWHEHENSLYMVLNRTLRLADRAKLQPWFKYLKLLLTAFFKLPPSEHTLVWRGAREDLSALYPENKEFAWWAFSSCTTSIDVLESPSYLGKSGTRTIFSIQTNRGKLIRAHSYFENEDEILLPPGIYLKVVGSLNPAEGLHIIQLREIPPPHQLLADPFDLSQLKHALPQSKSSSDTSTSPKNQENYSSTSVAPKPYDQVSSKKEEPQFIAPTQSAPYPQTKLFCGGYACVKCGFCRDWYWSPKGTGKKKKKKKRYTKRADATCTYLPPYDRGDPYPYGCPCHSDPDLGYPPYSLCACDDNRS